MVESFVVFTVVGLILTIHSIVEPYKRYRLIYSTSNLQRLFFIICISIVITIPILSAYYEINGIEISYFGYKLEFLLLLLQSIFGYLLVILILIKYFPFKPHIKRYDYFERTINSLLYQNRFEDVTNMFNDLILHYQRRLKRKKKIHKIKSNVSNVFYKSYFLISKFLIKLISFVKRFDQEWPKYRLDKIISNTHNTLIIKKIIAGYDTIMKHYIFNYVLMKDHISFDIEGNETIHVVLSNNEIISYIVNRKPYFGINLIKNYTQIIMHTDFHNAYFNYLIKTTNSILYNELKRINGYIQRETRYRYHISESDEIFKLFRNNLEIMQNITVWKPIGEVILLKIQNQRKLQEDNLNDHSEFFEFQLSPIFVGIQFFDIMVREAIYQKRNDHMWMYYYFHFVNEIGKNYKISSNSNPSGEFPNIYSRFLYEIITNIVDWLSIYIYDIDEKQDISTSKLSNTSSIMQDCVLVMNQSFRSIMTNDRIPNDFKCYILDIVLSLYFDFIEKNYQDYADVYLTILSEDNFSSIDYKNYLRSTTLCIQNYDFIRYQRLPNLISYENRIYESFRVDEDNNS